MAATNLPHTPSASNTSPDRKWEAALGRYQRLRARADRAPEGAPDIDALVEDYHIAMDHLVENVRAPDGDALIFKFDLAKERWEGFDLHDDWYEAFKKDVRYLCGHAEPVKHSDQDATWKLAVLAEKQARTLMERFRSKELAQIYTAYDQGTATYKEVRQVEDEWDAFTDAHSTAVDLLTLTPAPDLQAVALKVRLAYDDDAYHRDDGYTKLQVLQSDLDRLAAAPVSPSASAAASCTPFDVALRNYLAEYHAYNNASPQTAEEEEPLAKAFDRAERALDREPPQTAEDFVRKYVALHMDGGNLRRETVERLVEDGRRIVG